MNYYEILGVSAKADQHEIKRAFRKMALQYHPDRNADAHSSEQFRLVYIAYDVLQDPLKRSIYDMMQQVKEKCREEEEELQNEAYASPAERDYARRRRAYEAREQRRKEYFETHYHPDEEYSREEESSEDEDLFSSKLEFHSKQGLGFFFCFMLLCVGFTAFLFGSLFVIWEHFNGAILLGCTFWAVGVSLSFVAGKGLLAVFQTWKT